MAFNPASVNAVAVRFDFSSSSPLVLVKLSVGAIFTGIALDITSAFDDPAATITVGTSADPSQFLGPGDSSPGVVGQYSDAAIYEVNIPEFLLLTITSLSSTMGAGTLYYELRPT